MEALCAVKPSSMRCQPADQATVSAFFKAVADAGVASFYGPNWSTQIDEICAAEKPSGCAILGDNSVDCVDSFLCTTFRARGEAGWQEIPTGIAYQQVQQALAKSWSKYNPDYGTNGWFTDTANYETD